MNIAILIHGFPPDVGGGAEKQAYFIAKYLSGKHDVLVITRYKSKPAVIKKGKLTIKKIKTINLPILRFLSDILLTLKEIKKDKNKIDVIITFSFKTCALAGIIAKKLYKIPLIVTIRNESEYLSKNLFKRYIINPLVVNTSDAVFAQTEGIKKEFLKVYPNNKTFIVPNGIDMQRARATGKNILFVGRLIRRKGVKYLLEAAKQIRDCPKIIIVGDGPEKKKLENMYKNKRIEFIGKVKSEEVLNYLRKGFILVLPSLHSEGFPNVILEAMSFGVPVIATKVGGISDIIEHGKTGFLVEPKNPDELAYYIKKLLSEEELRKKMSNNCLKEVKKYSWDVVINIFEEQLNKAAGKRKFSKVPKTPGF